MTDEIIGARQAVEAGPAEIAPLVMWAYLGAVVKEYDALKARLAAVEKVRDKYAMSALPVVARDITAALGAAVAPTPQDEETLPGIYDVMRLQAASERAIADIYGPVTSTPEAATERRWSPTDEQMVADNIKAAAQFIGGAGYAKAITPCDHNGTHHDDGNCWHPFDDPHPVDASCAPPGLQRATEQQQ